MRSSRFAFLGWSSLLRVGHVGCSLIFFAALLAPTGWAQIALAPAGGTTPTETFTGFDGTGFAPSPVAGQLDSDEFIAGGFDGGGGDMQFGDTRDTNDFARGLTAGAVIDGGVYAFTTDGDGVGWGVQPASNDFNPGYFVVRYENTTGSTIPGITISYDVKIFNDEARSNSFDLSYSISGSATLPVASYEGGGAFADVQSAQVTSGIVGDLPPVAWTSQTVSVTINAPIGEGTYLFLRFSSMDNGGSGSRDQFAVDDLAVASLNATVGPAPGDIVVSEFMADPSGGTGPGGLEYGEYIELHNAAESAIDIDGWIVSDEGSDSHTISSGGPLSIPAGGFLVLCRTTTELLNGGLDNCDYAYGDDLTTDIELAQGADEIILNDGTTQIFKLDYSSGTPGGVGIAQELRAVSLVAPSGLILNTRTLVGGVLRTYVDSDTSGDLDADFGSPGAQGNTAIDAASMTLGAIQGESDDADIGWYMLAVPSTGMTLAQLAAQNHVQGVDGYFDDDADAANLYTFYDPGRPDATLDFVEPGTDANDDAGAGTPTDGTDYEFVPGQGLIWYHYDQPIAGGGAALPYTLTATGSEPASPVSLTIPAGEFYLAGNPFRASLSLDDVTRTSPDGTLSSVVQVWDPFQTTSGGTGGYRVLSTATPDLVPTWQGFFLENADANNPVSVSISDSDLSGGFFYGRQAASGTLQPFRRIGFELRGHNAEFDLGTFDGATFLHFHADATDGHDRHDGTKLSPLSGAYATLAFVGERDGEAWLRAVESRPYDAGDLDLDLDFQTSIDGRFEVTWPTWELVPDGWRIELLDRVTGTTTDLRTETAYAFDAAPTVGPGVTAATLDEARSALPTSLRATPSWTAAAARTSGPRFALRIFTSSVASEGDAVPDGSSVSEVYPNPFSPRAQFTVTLSDDQVVRAEVFDTLGRRVAVVHDGWQSAGRHAYAIEGSRWASGVYLIRVTGEQFVETRRVTLMR